MNFTVDFGANARSEALRLRFAGGYGSVFGDGARVEADLCQYCIKELIGPFCRVLPAQN